MMVVEYAREFNRLKKYAHHIIPTEVDRMQRFRTRLIWPIYNTMIATDFPSLSVLIDKAKQWESKRDEEKKEREQQRRMIGRGQEGKKRKEEVGVTTGTTDQPTNLVPSYT